MRMDPFVLLTDQCIFVFQGDKYTKYDKNFTPAAGNYPRLITQGFPGVLTPVDGAFQLNNHTWVFVSGKCDSTSNLRRL